MSKLAIDDGQPMLIAKGKTAIWALQMRNPRKVTSVTGCELRRQLRSPCRGCESFMMGLNRQ